MDGSAERTERSYAGLTPAGAIAALAVGACALAGGSWRFAAVLFAFFIPSILISRAGKRRKAQLVDTGKSGARDARQVLANGGVSACCALMALATHDATWGAAFAGAFAAACADTFGTEAGTLVRGRPHSILTWKPIAPGLSGGVTLAGTLAEIGGALLVAIVACAAGVAVWWMVAAAGMAGALVDSIVGACVQELRYCDACDRACETNPHACGAATRRIRGATFINNDAVNAACTLTGAGVAAAFAFVMSR